MFSKLQVSQDPVCRHTLLPTTSNRLCFCIAGICVLIDATKMMFISMPSLVRLRTRNNF